jgi:hypothetical protein
VACVPSSHWASRNESGTRRCRWPRARAREGLLRLAQDLRQVRRPARLPARRPQVGQRQRFRLRPASQCRRPHPLRPQPHRRPPPRRNVQARDSRQRPNSSRDRYPPRQLHRWLVRQLNHPSLQGRPCHSNPRGQPALARHSAQQPRHGQQRPDRDHPLCRPRLPHRLHPRRRRPCPSDRQVGDRLGQPAPAMPQPFRPVQPSRRLLAANLKPAHSRLRWAVALDTRRQIHCHPR